MDDSTLIEQIQLGSKDAFKQMFIKFYSPLCEYASQYVSDEDAEELIQELCYLYGKTEIPYLQRYP